MFFSLKFFGSVRFTYIRIRIPRFVPWLSGSRSESYNPTCLPVIVNKTHTGTYKHRNPVRYYLCIFFPVDSLAAKNKTVISIRYVASWCSERKGSGSVTIYNGSRSRKPKSSGSEALTSVCIMLAYVRVKDTKECVGRNTQSCESWLIRIRKF